MKTKTLIASVLLCGAVFLSCKDTKKEEEQLNKQLEQIDAVEQSIDSTLKEIDQKTENVNDLIKELDSI